MKIVNAEERSKDPSFQIPKLEMRKTLAVGDFAKLIFEEDVPQATLSAGTNTDKVSAVGERMWVKVTKIKGDRYLGIVANRPAVLHASISYGSDVNFGPENVIDIEKKRDKRPTMN